MKIEQFPEHIRPHILPEVRGEMAYACLSCSQEFPIDQLLYTCPACRSVLLLVNKDRRSMESIGGKRWREILDYRKMLNHPALKGIFRYHEFIAPILPLDDILYLGEGHTPMIEANGPMKTWAGRDFFFKNDGLNPSASFKDRGMACALSYLQYLVRKQGLGQVLAVCASTGDTSAAAALYASYLQGLVTSAVLLPLGKVTPQQLAQPLGAGAKVLEIPGVFDDCMKVVESLAEHYPVALLNSKNGWRILGQESFSFEIAQDLDYDVSSIVVTAPIGNAGNITAIMSGFLKFREGGIIDTLPKIVGVQSEQADPVFRYYEDDRPHNRPFRPVAVRPSVAQAAMIGNPVSMPRVIRLVEAYNQAAGQERVFVVRVTEQEIMDAMILANRNGNIACTQGGEALAGFKRAVEKGWVGSEEVGVLDSTAHVLKFLPFQNMYLENTFPLEFGVTPRPELRNAPIQVRPAALTCYPEPGKPLEGEDMKQFVHEMTLEIARILNLGKGS